MKITIVCIGKIKEKYFTDAILEYSKRLSRYVQLNITELNDEKAPENLSLADEENIKIQEGKRILRNIKDNSYIIALAIHGKKMNSEKMAYFMEDLKIKGKSHITFVIGGSLGLSNEVIKKADFLLSFSCMTFPHQLMRVILLEQIYRCERILKNEPYHK